MLPNVRPSRRSLSAKQEKKCLFIAWSREVQLSSNLANALGAELHQVYRSRADRVLIARALSYLIQSVSTIRILLTKKPKVVLVQNPPVFAALIVWFYARFATAKFSIDSHTSAFLDKRWIMFHWLFRWVARRAAVNTCHNYKNLEVLRSWGIEPAMVMQFCNPTYNPGELNEQLVDKRLHQAVVAAELPIMMVNNFAVDDDLKTVLGTARIMPEATFFVTGDKKAAKLDETTIPQNIVLTNHLAHKEFLKLMNRCKVILALTLRLDTVLWSPREAMALEKPFVTTDSEVQRHYYGGIGLFAGSDPEEVKKRIYEALDKQEEIKDRERQFLIKDKKRLEEEIETVKRLLRLDHV